MTPDCNCRHPSDRTEGRLGDPLLTLGPLAAPVQLVRTFVAAAKPVAAICHGPRILAAAGVLAGGRATCYRAVAAELDAAGARYEARGLVVDGGIITSRHPSDLPAFIDAVLRALGRN